MQLPVLICGEGLAACCCASLLKRSGLPFRVEASRGSNLPAILASPSTLSLLSDIFEYPGIFDGFHTIRRRIVAWGGGLAVTLPHQATVVSERALLDRLWAKVNVRETGDRPSGESWKLLTARRHPDLPQELDFGTRVATVTGVRLRPDAPDDACWVEAVRDGWLFLLATGGRQAMLISVGLDSAGVLEQSSLVEAQVEETSALVAEFPAYPRTLARLFGSGWLACGSAAMAFDPVCGEGAGNAAREAILAAAAIQALESGEDQEAVLGHYQTRLWQGLLRHLEICHEFYSRARQGSWWEGEIALLEKGTAFVRAQVAMTPAPRYRLAGFTLERI